MLRIPTAILVVVTALTLERSSCFAASTPEGAPAPSGRPDQEPTHVLGKRKAYYVSEYKRLPVYNFGLGKRSGNDNMESVDDYSDVVDEAGWRNDIERDPDDVENTLEDSDDWDIHSKRARPYGFGLGKRSLKSRDEDDIGDRDEDSYAKRAAYEFGLGKRAAYEFGLGKRAAYEFGLGKRAPYEFGLGKRSPSPYEFNRDRLTQLYKFGLGKRLPAYEFGLGKRIPIFKPGKKAYEFGLGKRAYEFGLGKKASYEFGLGKRASYEFGLGKKSGLGHGRPQPEEGSGLFRDYPAGDDSY